MDIKILLLGDAYTGKSTFLHRYQHGTHKNEYEITIGVDYTRKKLDSGMYVNIWDTAGQESFRAITTSYYRGAHGAFIFYDVSNRASFHNVSKWADDYIRHGGKNKLLIIANKTDKPRDVLTEEGEELADLYSAGYTELNYRTFNASKLTAFLNTIRPEPFLPTPHLQLKKKNDNKLKLGCGPPCSIQ